MPRRFRYAIDKWVGLGVSMPGFPGEPDRVLLQDGRTFLTSEREVEEKMPHFLAWIDPPQEARLPCPHGCRNGWSYWEEEGREHRAACWRCGGVGTISAPRGDTGCG